MHPHDGLVLQDPLPPVSPDVNPITLCTEEDEESMDGGSELSDVEDVFVSEEADYRKVSATT